MTHWKTICKVEDIPTMGARRVARKQGAEIAIFRTQNNKVFALLDKCPHKGGPLSQGIVYGESVACPLHNWQIKLTDGVAHAPDVGCAIKFSVQIENDEVALDFDEVNTLALDS
ncbi:MAG: nitrite reductase [Pseudomonadota bacterium]|jgi:nitrite reductase (NADH) small subunit